MTVVSLSKPTLTYWRKPTKAEIKSGHNAIRSVEVPLSKALDDNCKPYDYVVWADGLRYYYNK